MEITIGNKVQKLNFGFGFIHEANKAWNTTKNGIQVNLGVMYTKLAMETADIERLVDVIYFATVENSPRVGKKEVMNYISTLPYKEMEELFDEVQKELDASVPVKFAVTQIEKTAKKALN